MPREAYMPYKYVRWVSSDVARYGAVLVEHVYYRGGELAAVHVLSSYPVYVLDGTYAVHAYDVDFVRVTQNVAVGAGSIVHVLRKPVVVTVLSMVFPSMTRLVSTS